MSVNQTAKPRPRPRYRAHDWISTKTLEPMFSIQASVGKSGWMHVSQGGKPLFFKTAAERDVELKEMNRG